jgi:hypothetical protein
VVEKTSRWITRTASDSRSGSWRIMSANFGAGSTASTGWPRRASGSALRPVPAPTSRIGKLAGSAAAVASAQTRASGSVPKSGGWRVATQ